MAKLFDPKTSAVGSGMKGVYVSNAVIKEIKVNDNPGQYPKDFNYVFKLDKKVGEETYETIMFVAGNMFKDGSIPPHYSSLLFACGITDQPNQNSLIEYFSKGEEHPHLFQFFKGKEIQILTFVSGSRKDDPSKPNYKIWDGRQEFSKEMVNTYSVETPIAEVVEAFKKQLDTGYPPKYTPELLPDKTDEEPKSVDDVMDEDESI